MTSRVKKMFHRKKDHEVEKSTIGSRPSTGVRGDPNIRTSLYEDATAGTLPQTGDFPVKGNDSSVVLQQQGRKSSLRSLRSRRNSGSQHQSPVPAQYEHIRKSPQMTPPPPSNSKGAGSYDSYEQDSGLTQNFSGLHLGSRQGPTTTTTTVTTTHFPQYVPPTNRGPAQAQGTTNPNTTPVTRSANQDPARQGPYTNRGAPQSQRYGEINASTSLNRDFAQTQGYDDQSGSTALRRPRQSEGDGDQKAQGHHANRDPTLNAGYGDQTAQRSYAGRSSPQTQAYGVQKPSVRAVNDSKIQGSPTSKASRSGLPSSTRPNAYATRDETDGYDDSLAREPSIPRKQVGASASTGYSSAQQSSPTNAHSGRDRQEGSQNPRTTAPATAGTGYGSSRNEAPFQHTSVLDRSRPIASKDDTALRSAQDIVNRAKSNTYDTEVIEKVAPAVVHETVHKDVHHVREEVVTREIHNHDVYHRILPIIDVEVLPPRHFLPVEGGGLVEVSASEVPGRGQNWVIAETASKIPSDQAAPQSIRGFTARTFPGSEGDAIEYTSPEGYQKTEQTWVHPPELEDGARLTGQSWPMRIGDAAPEKGMYGYSSPKSKKKHSRTNSKVSANVAQGADGLGRTV